MQPDVFADAVVVMVKNALAPVLADVKSLQSQVAVWESRWNDVGALRERVAVVEAAKAAVAPPAEPVPVDLSPVLERVSAAEARLAVLGDLRDRLVVVETKAAQPVIVPAVELPAPIDLSPVIERVAAAEARLDVLGDLRDRVVVVETKAAQPIRDLPAVDLSPVTARIASAEVRLDEESAKFAQTLTQLDTLTKENAALRERVAVAEMRQLIPGPTGRDGNPGRDGKDGKDGLDGLGWDDLNVTQVDERSFTVKCLRGLQVKELGTLTFPVEIYRGVYQDGKTYDRGDGVTWGGSEWHCNETTNSKPGDGSKAWTLKVKRGRDGKDFTPVAAVPAPVVSVGKR